MRYALFLLMMLAACDPWDDVKKADTIEAYEKYIAENPSGSKAIEARARLEQLYIEVARKDKTIEAYDAYIKRFPKGDLAKEAHEEREKIFWSWAEKENSPEAWQRFVDENPKSDHIKKARGRLRMAQNKDAVALGEPTMKKVNLAEDPKGELNGWGFYVDATNKGTKPIEYLNIQVQYLDGNGEVLGSKDWPVVAKALPGNLPFEDGFDKPIAPGETRTWEWTEAMEDMPKGWTESIKVLPVNIRLVGESEPPNTDRNLDMTSERTEGTLDKK